MRTTTLILLLALPAVAQGRFDRFNSRTNQGRSTRGFDATAPTFEAFGTDGRGTNGVCSTTAPTGSTGQVLTFARASSAMCTKTISGVFATSGIADSDLVSLSSGVIRVEYDSDGYLSALIEKTTINLLQRNTDWSNAAWTKDSLGVAAPTVTAAAGTAPDGTRTATRLQFPATTLADFSRVYQAAASAPGTTATGSFFLRGCIPETDGGCAEGIVSAGDGGVLYADGGVARQADGGVGAGTIDLWVGTTPICQACTYVASSWSICEKTTGNRQFLVVGNSSSSCAATRPGQDIKVWGAQLEDSPHRTSVNLTAGATATRAADAPFFAIPSTEIQCLSAVVQLPASLVGNARVLGAATGATNTLSGYATGPGTTALHVLQTVGGSSKDFASSINATISTTQRLSVWVNPSVQLGTSMNGTESTTTSGVLGAVTGVTKIYPGCYEGGTGFELGGHIGRMQGDAVYTRCTR